MLPVFIKLGGDLASAWWLYLLALVLVAYAAFSGWKGATPAKGAQAPTREQRIQRAAVHGIIGAVLARIGLYYALPKELFLGGKGEGIPVHTYGLMLAGGFMGAVALSAELSRKEWRGALGEKRRDQVFDLAFWIFLAGVGGAKLLFILVNWKDFSRNLGAYFSNPLKLVDCLGGGLVFYGGLIGAAVAIYLYCRHHRIEFIRYLDNAFPAVSFGQALGRLGCYAAGCCWGHTAGTQMPLAVTFPGPVAAQPLLGQAHTGSLAFTDQAKDPRFVELATGRIFETAQEGTVQISRWVSEHGHTLPVHPTQLYESIGQFCILGLLLFVRRYRRFHGMISGLWLVLYACLRTTVELFRGDVARGTLHGLLEELGGAAVADKVPLEAWYNISISQFISLCIFSVGVTLLVRQSRPLREASHPPASGAASAA